MPSTTTSDPETLDTNAKKQEGSATTKLEAQQPAWLLASRGPTTLSFVFAVKFKE
jgi:hypothetical protein